MEILLQPESLVSLLTLTAMEIVLGIDNVIFISILVGKLPRAQQPLGRNLGLGLALFSRLALLFVISWVMGLTKDLFSIAGHGFSGRDLILLLGGIFLVGKATHEIYEKLEVEGEEHEVGGGKKGSGAFAAVIIQIILLDIVFSLDSVITAVGMAKHISIMVIAMVIAVAVMLVFAGKLADFVNRHPSMKLLALSFLLLIGVMLTAEGMGQHIGKGYIYSAMAFSLVVELLNMKLRKKTVHKPVHLHDPYEHDRPRGGKPAKAR
jgi:predicted tellurium resistance membrane protein TerC